MLLLGKLIVENFKKKHSTSRKSLDAWVQLIEQNTFGTPQDLQDMFANKVYIVGEQIVFDVGGNKVRAITKIQYGSSIIVITHILTHSEYDKEKWKDKK